MPVTTLDPLVALIVIDLQKGVVNLPLVHPVDEVVKNTVALVESFRARQLPVVLVNVNATAPGRTEQPPRSHPFAEDWSDLIPELNIHPTAKLLTKRSWGAFQNTDLEQWLKQGGITHVVLAGIATSIGVESTARQAYERGFNVTLAVDAMTDRNLQAHLNSITHIFPRLGETGRTLDILELLERRQPQS
jgi:nicotinamidase-related amidase